MDVQGRMGDGSEGETVEVYDIICKHTHVYVCQGGCLMDVMRAQQRDWVVYDSYDWNKIYCKMHGLPLTRYPKFEEGRIVAYSIRLKMSQDHGFSEEEIGEWTWCEPGVGY